MENDKIKIELSEEELQEIISCIYCRFLECDECPRAYTKERLIGIWRGNIKG